MHPEVSDTSNDPDLIWKPLMKVLHTDVEQKNQTVHMAGAP